MIENKEFINQMIDLSDFSVVDSCYFKNCEIIIDYHNKDCDVKFANVVFDNCKIRHIDAVSGIENSELGTDIFILDRPIKCINTHVDFKGDSIYALFAFKNVLPIDNPYFLNYMNRFCKGCTINGKTVQPIDNMDDEISEFLDVLEEKFPVFKMQQESHVGNNKSSSFINESSNKRDVFSERFAKLEAIERATGENMGFQKGMLDVEFGKTVYVKNPDDPEYSSYDAGVLYAMVKRDQKLRGFFKESASDVISNDSFKR